MRKYTINIVLALGILVVSIAESFRGGFIGIVEVVARPSRSNKCTSFSTYLVKTTGQLLNHYHDHLVPRQSSPFHIRRWRKRHIVSFALPHYQKEEPTFETQNREKTHHHCQHQQRRVIILSPIHESSRSKEENVSSSNTIFPSSSWHNESSQHLEKIAKDYQLPILLLDEKYGNKMKQSTSEFNDYTYYLTAVPYPRIDSYALAIGTTSNNNNHNQQRKTRKTKISSAAGSEYFVDLFPPPGTGLGYRLHEKSRGGGEELLLKALGVSKMINRGERSDDDPIVIYDLTAGLARDSLVILTSFLDHWDTASSSSSSSSSSWHGTTPRLKLHMVERDPIVALLLSDAMRRLNLLADHDVVDASKYVTEDERNRAEKMKQCLSMEEGDGVSVLNRLMSSSTIMGDAFNGNISTTPSTTSSVVVPYPPDICYLDPMFPPRKKQKSAVKKDMAMLHSLLGTTVKTAATRDEKAIIADGDCIAPEVLAEDQRLKEEQALLLAACNVAKKRVVVKRPIGASPLGDSDLSTTDPVDFPKPSFDVRGSANRFDVYLIQ